MAQNLTNFDNVLKEFYGPAIRETINNEVVAFKELDESDKEWAGRRVNFPVHTARNPGVGGRAEGGTLPSASQQGYQLAQISSTYQYGRIQLSGQVIQAGKNAFAAAMESEMKGVARDLVNDLGRQTWGTGDGRMAQVGTAAASVSTIAVYNRYFEPCQPGALYIYQGQELDIGTVASPASLTDGASVASVSRSKNPATNTDSITISGSANTASQCESFLFNGGAGGCGVEMMGLLGIVDQFTEANIWGSNAFFGSALQNINRASITGYNSIVLGNSGVERVIDGYLMESAFDEIHVETGFDPDFIWGSHAVVRAFLDSVAADRRYGTPVFDAGVKSLTYNGLKLIKDRQCPPNQLLVGKKSALKMYTLSDIKFDDTDGSILSRVSDQDAFEAFIRTYKNLGLEEDPKCLCMIRDIKVDL